MVLVDGEGACGIRGHGVAADRLRERLGHPRGFLRRIASELRAGARALERISAPRYARPPWGDFDERVGALAARVRPGSIILAHDGRGNRDSTLVALPTLLARLGERGFELVTVSELMRVIERRPGDAT